MSRSNQRPAMPGRCAVMGRTIVAGTVAVAATGLAAGVAEAQQAAPVELPAVVVTSPSPVAKPKKPKPKPAQLQQQQQASPSSPPSPSPQSQPPPPADETAATEPVPPAIVIPPGTLIVVDDAFAPVTVATDRDVLAASGATVTDTLQTRPGIVGTTFAPGANRPVIRGLDSYRVRVQENGIGSHDVSTISEDHAVPIDPFSAERIEVVRGPATLRYGSGAIGGVVAIENQRIPTSVPARGFSGEIKGGLSSVDDGRDGAFRASAGSSGVVVHADAFKRSADDYETPRGTQRNSFVESEGFGVGISRIWSDGYLGISVSRIDSVYGVPGEEADEGVDPRIDLAQQKLQARGEWRPRVYGIEAVRFWFGASDYRHNELAKHDGEDEFEVGSRFTNREQEGRVELQHAPLVTALGELTGAIGVQYGYKLTRGQSFEGESLLEPAQTRSIAAFWFEELRLSPSLQLQFASRIEQTAVDGRGWSQFVEGPGAGGHHPWFATDFAGERTFAPVSVSLGALQSLPFGMTARLSGQYVERAPDAAELFSKGMHEATGTFEVGNPFMDKEKAFTLEAGLAKSSGPFRFDAAAYYTRYQGFIYRQLTGVVCEPERHNGHFHCEEEDHHGGGHGGGGGGGHGHEHEFDLVYFQQRDATFYGVEFAAQLDVAPIWNGVWGVDARYDFVNASFKGGEKVPRIPPHRLGGGVYYRDGNWFARAGLLHAFDQTRIGLEEEETPGYTLVSAELSYTQAVGEGTIVTIGLKGENLADDEVLNHASFKRREEVLAPGASVRLFGSIKFD